MKRKRAKELLPVIQAWAEGKTIQYRPQPDVAPGDWQTCFETGAEPNFNALEEYRVKPEPREFWIGICKGTGRSTCSDRPLEKECSECEIIHVREVI